MFWQQAAFWLFAFMAVVSGLMVVTARNPVHSVLFLIFAFFNSAGLFVLMGAEFLGLILVVVYVGAVAVLFLFVVMMLDIDVTELRRGITRYLPVGLLLAFALGIEFAIIIASWQVSQHAAAVAPNPTPAPSAVSNTVALGSVLYTDYVYLFQVAGLILLVAMIGAIVLTLRHREGVKRQSIARQVGRRAEEAIALVKIEPGQGIH
ncbi:MAG TPA: NADH-quinone oxidoreductase subunit J [Alphaproteobacteria bacterium]|nr:NADH-quinone oxidoreductase subunit J [Alphaproteobacteria bacterium]